MDKGKVETIQTLKAPKGAKDKAVSGVDAGYKISSNSAEKRFNLDESSAPKENGQPVTKKIVKEGEISFETKSIPETRKAIYNSLQKLGGYIAEENETNDSSIARKMYVLKARVPEKNFEEFLNGVSSNAARIDAKNIRAKDVTAEFIDFTTQLTNKKKLEDRYVELLKKGSKMSDLLEIEDKITEIQTDIDGTQGQLNYLAKQVEYSSLDITFYTKPVTRNNEPTFGVKVVSALSDGWDIFGAIFLGCLAAWPIWVIAATAYFIYTAWRKKHQQSKQVQL